jgi:membrane-bound lytic murein transglycosylase D
VGQRLTIYPRKFEEPVAQNTTKPKSSSTEEVAQTYTVRQGDSLWSISRKFPGVSVDNLKKWNDISGTKLKPGMKLRIYKS